jgi:hypothetical protein
VSGGGPAGSDPGPAWKAVGTDGFNVDGVFGLLWQNTDGQAAVWEVTGNGAVSGGGAVGANPGPSWKAIATESIVNSVNDADLLWQNANGQVAIWD